MGGTVAKSNIPFLSSIEGEYELNTQMAKAAEADARYNADQRRKAADQLMGEQIAAAGTSGVEISGSVTDVIKNDRAVAEQEALNIIYSGKLKSWQMKRSAMMQRRGAYEGLALKAGSMFLAGGVGGGAGAAASGAAAKGSMAGDPTTYGGVDAGAIS